ncbi:MAG: cytochrome c3 family protein [Myxococcales bacterium]|nr:cytochrome c3 family protein [Myxococcales bacterium]
MSRYLWIGALVVLVACAGVLGFRKAPTEVFPHRKHVVAGVSCTRCHVNIEKETAALHLPDDATCTSCHNPPHDPRPCLGCHAPAEAIAKLVETRDHLKFAHARHLGGEAKGNCMHCHTGVAEGDRAMLPPMAVCFNCHAHDAARDARTCETCHKNLTEERVLPQSHLAHDGDWLREHGTRAASSGDLCETCHKQSFCAECHGVTAPAIPAKLRFADPMSPSVHRAGFTARHSLEARAQPGACTTCHQPDRCLSCHLSRNVAGDKLGSPHPAGWVGLTASENRHGREARRDPAACASCHSGAGEKLCVTCHAVGGVGGNPHPPGYSSRQPLSSMPCRMCHPIGAR